MSDTYRFVLTDHAAWRTTPSGGSRVFVLPDGGQWLVTIDGADLLPYQLADGGARPQLDSFTVEEPAVNEAPALFKALAELGTVARFRTPDLWEAIATAIIRQVIRAAHARQLQRNLCDVHGNRISSQDGDEYALFPDVETVLDLDDEQFANLGMTFKHRPLRTAAEAYLKHGSQWRELPPGELVTQLQLIPRIGPWTAGAAVADFTNDFSYYPYADLAVRTWAKRAAPSYSWPDDEKEFGRLWRRLAGSQLAPTTLLTLAWGSHHGDTG
jgi:DNA-3-methyladenine glycosylase II